MKGQTKKDKDIGCYLRKIMEPQDAGRSKQDLKSTLRKA
jgi:TPP-dependent indolepyruvate ferredoxin oxidoreductase alpha subunit